MTRKDVKREVERVWASRRSGNRDAQQQADQRELDLYRRIARYGADNAAVSPYEVYDLLGEALDAHPTARTYAGRPNPNAQSSS